MTSVRLSRINLLTLLCKLDRVAAGGMSACQIVKHDQGEGPITITAVEDRAYYHGRPSEPTHPDNEPWPVTPVSEWL